MVLSIQDSQPPSLLDSEATTPNQEPRATAPADSVSHPRDASRHTLLGKLLGQVNRNSFDSIASRRPQPLAFPISRQQVADSGDALKTSSGAKLPSANNAVQADSNRSIDSSPNADQERKESASPHILKASPEAKSRATSPKEPPASPVLESLPLAIQSAPIEAANNAHDLVDSD